MFEYILTLLVTLVGRFGAMLAIGLFVLTLVPLGKLGVGRRPDRKYRWMLGVLFGLLGIMGTYGGDIVFESYANLRGVYVITGGLLGGPLVGFLSGLIAGGHRFLIDIGGFSTIPCSLATLLEGTAAGYVSLHLKGNNLNWRAALVVGLVGESIHQIMVLSMAKPFDQAVELVKVIAVPMIAVNTFGAVLFVQTLHLLFEYRSQPRLQPHKPGHGHRQPDREPPPVRPEREDGPGDRAHHLEPGSRGRRGHRRAGPGPGPHRRGRGPPHSGPAAAHQGDPEGPGNGGARVPALQGGDRVRRRRTAP